MVRNGSVWVSRYNEFSDDLDADTTSLIQIFLIDGQRKPFFYTDDFDDNWVHRVSFLNPSKKHLFQYAGIPICVKAVGRCPPEDCGGPNGYAFYFNNDQDNGDPERQEENGIGLYESTNVSNISLQNINLQLRKFFESEEY